MNNAAFFRLQAFGTEAMITTETSSYSVRGIFENEYETVNVGELGVESSGPKFTAATETLPGVADSDTIKVKEVTYTVRDVEPDGTGITTLRLDLLIA